jgi:hypothetical protein
LIDGIGYIWIMRVFFVIALFNPFLMKISNKIKNNFLYLCLIVFLFLCYQFFIELGCLFKGTMQRLYSDLFLCSIGYTIISAIGIRLPDFKQKEILITTIICFIIFILFMNYYKFSFTQKFKYPPQFYYIAYGLFMSFLLYWLFGFISIKKFFERKFVFFLSKTSIWLYFYHIIFIYVFKLYLSNINIVENYFFIRFSVIFFPALLITWFHEILKNKLRHVKKF